MKERAMLITDNEMRSYSKLKQVYLEVKMENIHLMHVLQSLTDLAYEQHRVQLCQVVVLVDDAVKQLPSLYTARNKSIYNVAALEDEKTCRTSTHVQGMTTYYSMTRMTSWRDSKAAYSWMRLAWLSWFITWISFLTTSWNTDRNTMHFTHLQYSMYRLFRHQCLGMHGGSWGLKHRWWCQHRAILRHDV